MSDPIIAVRQLGKTVTDSSGELVLLADIDFEVERGQSVAILGASGSGKSTLLSIIAGLDTPTHGEVWVDGNNLFDRDEDARAALRARQMGFVFQSFQLLGNLTAQENVMLPLEIAGQTRAKEQAKDWLEQVGLGTRLHHYPKTLSGGEQQRVALARAFVVSPKVLLADEPTGSLDAATGERILSLMLQLNKAQGTTLILVTHDLALARRCDRQIRLEAGRLVT
jgi:putative ABC transport system ATP-binding protein